MGCNRLKPVVEELYEDVLRPVGGELLDAVEYIPVDYAETVRWVADKFPYFTEEERKVFLWRYVDEMTLYDIGERLAVSRERVRQILWQSKRKMRYDKNNLYRMVLNNGLSMYQEVLEDYKDVRERQKDDMALRLSAEVATENLGYPRMKQNSIRYCDFSNRLYNALLRSGLDDINKIAEIENVQQLLKVRNLGAKCIDELCEYFLEHDIEAKWMTNAVKNGGKRNDRNN